MNVTDALKATHATGSLVLSSYLGDLSDADLMQRPHAGCNHLAWQMGHLISSECMLLDSICADAAPELPAGFAESHDKDHTGENDPSKFCTKQEYLDLMKKVGEASSATFDKLSESDLDEPAPEHFRSMFPTVGHVCVLIATHQLMHAGQFVPVRRELGKPVKI
jgi:hypothetical protein